MPTRLIASVLCMLSLFLLTAPVHAAVLYSQPDDTGSPVSMSGSVSYGVAPHGQQLLGSFVAKAQSEYLFIQSILGLSNSGNVTGMPRIDLCLNPTCSTGNYGSIGYSASQHSNGGSLIPDLSEAAVPAQKEIATFLNQVGLTIGQTYDLVLESSDWAYYPQAIFGTAADNTTPYFIISDTPPNPFYSQISNSPGGALVYEGASTSTIPLKRLPNDWVVQVSSTTDFSGSPLLAGGYQWYQVIDPTDGTTGWMEGATASGTEEYLPYDAGQQVSSLVTSSDEVMERSSRASKIIEAVDHYYANTSTSSSLYSSDDVSGYQISRLRNGVLPAGGDQGYPEQLVLGIIAQESGEINPNDAFDNENITSDFGHGIMQVTFAPSYFDNRGLVSEVLLPQCDSQNSVLYENCYSSPAISGSHYRNYTPDTAIPGNPLFKQYSNTSQSIYANIKDGMGLLSQKYATYSSILASTTIDGVTYSADDIKDILATERYNGGDSACGYVDRVATKLDNIGNYFPTATTSSISDLIQKMHSAGEYMVCAKLHSPGDLTISDTNGHTAGTVNGQEVDTFPLAVSDGTTKSVEVLAAQDGSYKYQVVGTENGMYDLDIMVKNGDQSSTFQATDIPTSTGQVHTYTIDETALAASSTSAVSIQIDSSGSGVHGGEQTIVAGPFITGSEFSQALAQSTTSASTTANSTQSSTSTTTISSTNSTSTSTSTSTPSSSSSSPDSTSECLVNQNRDFTWYINQLKLNYIKT